MGSVKWFPHIIYLENPSGTRGTNTRYSNFKLSRKYDHYESWARELGGCWPRPKCYIYHVPGRSLMAIGRAGPLSPGIDTLSIMCVTCHANPSGGRTPGPPLHNHWIFICSVIWLAWQIPIGIVHCGYIRHTVIIVCKERLCCLWGYSF